jgi:hypothetical protein
MGFHKTGGLRWSPDDPGFTWLRNPTPSASLKAGSNVEKHDVRMGNRRTSLRNRQAYSRLLTVL